jgi:hypothetical protein
MAYSPQSNHNRSEEDFSRMAAEAPTGFLGEFWIFLKQNKKWWLTPIVLTLLLLGLLIALGGSAAAPFIYTLF